VQEHVTTVLDKANRCYFPSNPTFSLTFRLPYSGFINGPDFWERYPSGWRDDLLLGFFSFSAVKFTSERGFNVAV
jgi:hypothetical protein